LAGPWSILPVLEVSLRKSVTRGGERGKEETHTHTQTYRGGVGTPTADSHTAGSSCSSSSTIPTIPVGSLLGHLLGYTWLLALVPSSFQTTTFPSKDLGPPRTSMLCAGQLQEGGRCRFGPPCTGCVDLRPQGSCQGSESWHPEWAAA
jgi:hypothetical protein